MRITAGSDSADSQESEMFTMKKKSKMMDEHMESHNRLHMLAAVASHHLHSDPTMKSYSNNSLPQKFEVPTSNVKFSPSNNGLLHSKRKRTPCRKMGDSDLLSLEQIRELSAHHLLKCFSDFDGNELKRTFTYSCVLDPTRCQKKFSSFGSELKARQQMKIHLLEHVDELSEEALSGIHFKAETVQSRQRRQVDAANSLSKKKKSAFRTVAQPLKVPYSIKEECKQKIAPNTSKNVYMENIAKDSKYESALSDETSIGGNLLEVVIKKEHMEGMHYVKKENVTSSIELKNFPSEVIVHNGEKESKAEDKKTEDPVALLDHNYVLHGNSDNLDEMKDQSQAINVKQEWGCDKNENMLKNAIKTGTEEKSKYTSAELNKFMVSETLHDMIMVCVLEEEKLQLKQLPCVGSEMDVKTGQAKEALPKKVTDSESEEESREIKVIHNNIERDEYRLKKKPKGKAKFIGQSKAEKEMAIQMIESIKSRVTTLESLECQICNPPRSFTAPTTLISHYRSHAGIKPYECRLCRSVFTRQHSLNYHMLIHSNQTRFTCSDCGRKFRHPSHFKEHRRRHTGESPYECSDCMFRFKTRNTYKRHMRTHHGKMLTPSGELLVLSDDEYKQARALPRIPTKPVARIISKGKGADSTRAKVPQNERNVCEDEEIDFASHDSDSSEANSDSNHQDDMSPAFTKVDEIGAFKEANKENNGKVEMKEPISRQCATLESCKAGMRKGYFKDIVKEAMRQSDIPFSSDFRSYDNETIISDPIDFSVTEVVDSCENSYFDELSLKASEDNNDESDENRGLNSSHKVVKPQTESQEKSTPDAMNCIYLNTADCVTLGNQNVEVVCGTSYSNATSEGPRKDSGINLQKNKSTMLLFKPVIVNQGATTPSVLPRKNSVNNTGNNILPQPVSILTCQPVNSSASASDGCGKEGQASKKIIIRAEGTLIDALKNQALMLMNDDTSSQISLCPINNHSLSVKSGVYTGETTQL